MDATIKITGVPLDQITPQIQKALDDALAGTLNLQQGELAKANPKDSGRMAASWNIGHNKPDLSVKPEGQQSPEPDAYEGKITFDGDWYISNNLPYAMPVCALGNYPASWRAGGHTPPTSIPENWFWNIANQSNNVFDRQYDKVKP